MRKNAALMLPVFATLLPDVVFDALQRMGFESDGRLFELNSYENRVYQIGLSAGGACIAKF